MDEGAELLTLKGTVAVRALKAGNANLCDGCRQRALVERRKANILIGSIVKSLTEWSKEPGAVNYFTIASRLCTYGWSPLSSVFGDRYGNVPGEVLERLGLAGHRIVRPR